MTDNKVIAITGASSGIGAETARHLAEGGAKVVLGARRREELETLCREIMQVGGTATSVIMDVTKREDLTTLVDHACKSYGRLDVLVSNAGVGPISMLDDLKVEEWEKMVDVNIKGLLFGVAAALPVFRRQKSGHVINLGSTAGQKTVPAMAVYSGTKFAVRAISEGLRQEAGADLRVTVINPGLVKTSFVDEISDVATREKYADMRDKIAMDPRAVARAVAYAIEQPPDIDVGELVVRPTAQG